MTRLFVLAAGLVMAGPAAASAQGLVLADGTPYDSSKEYKAAAQTAARRVTVAGYAFKAAPGPNAPARGDVLPRFGTSAFLQPGSVWQSKAVAVSPGVERTYHLLAEVNNDRTVGQVYGWVPDHLLLPALPRAMPVRVVEQGKLIPTRVPRRGMVVNTLEVVQGWQKQQKADPAAGTLFRVPAAKMAAELDAGACPPALIDAFKDNGFAVGKAAAAVRRPDVRGWRLTFRDGPDDAGGVQQYLAAEENGELVVRESANMAWVYGRPAADSEAAAKGFRRKSFTVSNVFFIYQELDAALDPVPPGAARAGRTYCLVGSVPDVPGDQAHLAIHGWIETSRLSEWPTAMALEWDRPSTLPPGERERAAGVRWEVKLPNPADGPRRGPDGLLFHNREAAEGWMRAVNVYSQTGAPADKAAVDQYRIPAGGGPAPVAELRDPADPGVSRRLGGLEMRFPVLRTDGKHEDTQLQLYQLGWFGPIKSVGGPDVDDAQRSAARKKLLAAQQAAKTVDLVFVIDGTGSMTVPRNEVVPDVLATCLTQLDTIRRGGAGGGTNPFRDLTVRARVVLYGRSKGRLVTEQSPASNGQAGAANPAEVVSAALGDGAIPGRIRGLADWVKGKNLPADGPVAEEPVFDALLKALEADAAPDSTKFVVLLADMPDVSREDGAKAVGKARTVIQSLVGVEEDLSGKVSFTAQPRNFIAVQLPPAGGWDNPASAPAADLLTAQLRAIEKELTGATIRLANGTTAPAGVEAAVELAREKDPARLNARIGEILRGSFDRVRDRLDRLVRDTRLVESGAVRPDGVDPATFRHWAASGVRLEELAADGVQVYQPVFGYARVPAPLSGGAGGQDRTQLRPVFLVQRTRAEDLRRAMKVLVDGLDVFADNPAKAKGAIQEIITDLLKADQRLLDGGLDDGAVAELARSLTLTEVFKRLAGVEFRPGSVLDLDRLLESNKGLSAQSRVRLLLAYHRLNELLTDGTEGEYRVYEGPRPGGGTQVLVERVGPLDARRRADRTFTFPGFPDNPWLWLDQEYHLP